MGWGERGSTPSEVRVGVGATLSRKIRPKWMFIFSTIHVFPTPFRLKIIAKIRYLISDQEVFYCHIT